MKVVFVNHWKALLSGDCFIKFMSFLMWNVCLVIRIMYQLTLLICPFPKHKINTFSWLNRKPVSKRIKVFTWRSNFFEWKNDLKRDLLFFNIEFQKWYCQHLTNFKDLEKKRLKCQRKLIELICKELVSVWSHIPSVARPLMPYAYANNCDRQSFKIVHAGRVFQLLLSGTTSWWGTAKKNANDPWTIWI